MVSFHGWRCSVAPCFPTSAVAVLTLVRETGAEACFPVKTAKMAKSLVRLFGERREPMGRIVRFRSRPASRMWRGR
jgi:hypothetical protein